MFTQITPREPVSLFGREGRPMAAGKVATELEANVICLPSADGLVLLVGIDTLFASTAFKAAVLSRLAPRVRERIEALLFVATHTHNAPALDPSKPLLGKTDTTYFDATAHAVADLISRTVEHGQPPIAQVLRASDACHLNAIRRRRGLRIGRQFPFLRIATNMVPRHGPDVPRDTQIAVAVNEAGKPLWLIWSWCCHATASPDPAAVCADYPGYVRDHLRRHLSSPDLPVVFLPGFSGDVRPDPSIFPIAPKSQLLRPLQRTFAMQTPANFGKLCRALAASTDRMLASLRPVEYRPISSTGHCGVRFGDLFDGCDTAIADGKMEITALPLGDNFGLLLVGAEVCSPYIAMVRRSVPAGWLLSGYCDQVFGYLPTDRQIAEGGYESEGFIKLFSLRGRFHPNIEAAVVAAVESAVADSAGHSMAKQFGT